MCFNSLHVSQLELHRRNAGPRVGVRHMNMKGPNCWHSIKVSFATTDRPHNNYTGHDASVVTTSPSTPLVHTANTPVIIHPLDQISLPCILILILIIRPCPFHNPHLKISHQSTKQCATPHKRTTAAGHTTTTMTRLVQSHFPSCRSSPVRQHVVATVCAECFMTESLDKDPWASYVRGK